MRKIVFLTWTFLAVAIMAKADRIVTGAAAEEILHGAELVRFVDRTAAPAFIKFRTGQEVPIQEAEDWVRKALGMSDHDGWVVSEVDKDPMGYTHRRFLQTYKGLPVEGSMYLLHTHQGKLISMNGEFYPDLSVNHIPTLSEAQGLQSALNHVQGNLYQWQVPGAEAFLQMETGNPMATFYPHGELVIVALNNDVRTGDFRLAWKFNVYAAEPLSRSDIYVDANTGQIIFEKELIHTTDVQGTAVTAYSGTQTMTADSTAPGNYRLRETGRGNGIETYDLNNSNNYAAATDFTDTDNFWNNVNANLDQYATDAHWGAEKTYDFFWTSFNRNSIDGNGFALLSYVHYNSNFVNAFWDGQRMTYGDGNGGSFTPLTALDVTGHEITHGLTNFTANLVYQNESGALNESFSDIFGNAIEQYSRPSQWSWIVGEDMTSGGIRNMQNPNSFNDPDTYLGTHYYLGTADNGGVHTNSGVQNKWYQILTDGESGTNDNGDAYNVPSQGFTKSSAIAFRNLTVYLTPNSDHADARFYGIQSAIDLYGPCTPEVIATTNAWYAVGVGGPFVFSVTADFAAPTDSFCSVPALVSFNNVSTNGGSFYWEFGDGSTSTAVSPTHTYNALGTYTVSMIAYGGPCGNDTLVRTQYIHIDTNITCSITLNPSNANSMQTSCTGVLYDTGGPNNNYGNQETSEITIAPTGASTVTLNFQSFDFETNWDYLYIYDGPTTASPQIGAYTGNTLPNGGTITSTNGAITLVQFTDQSVTAPGFELTWTCALPTAPPNTDFSADNLQSCNGVISFLDLSTNGVSNWDWDFGDGGSSTQQNPTHVYAANGTYTVKLVTSNQVGSDSLIRTAYINVAKPNGPAATGGSRCGPGTVTLNASGGGDYYWYDAATGGNLLGTGASFTTPGLTNSGVYYVEERSPGGSQFASNVGPATPASVGGGGYHNNTSTQYLEFTVFEDMTFISAFVDPGGSGNRTITLWDGTGTFIRDTTMNIGNQPQRINLGWNLVPGDYRIGGTQMDLYRNNAGPTYPYDLGNIVSITGSSAGNAFYYYLYDWEVSTFCRSLRTSVPATITPPPTVTVSNSGSNTICPGGSTTLTASGASTYQWSTGASGSSITVNQAGTYYAIGSVGAGCSDTSATITIQVGNPTANITPNGPTTICPGGSVTLSANSGSGYSWSSGGSSQSITVTAAGTYTVTVTDGNGCTATASQTVTVTNPTANITPNGPTTLCAGNTVTLTANSGTSYNWSTGANSQGITVGSSGTYTVTVTDANGCTAVASQAVSVTNTPTVNISSSTGQNLCIGDTTTLMATAGNSYLWSNGATTQSIPVTNSGTFDVTVTFPGGCSGSSVTPFTVNAVAPPVAGITTTGDSICQGSTTTLTASGNGGYTWSSGPTTASITVGTAGTYTVTVSGNTGCTDVATVGIFVNPLPTPTISSSNGFSFCQGDSTELTAAGGTGYNWNTGPTTSSIVVSAAGNYAVTVTDNNGCTAIASQTVTVEPNPVADFTFVANNQVVDFTNQSSGGTTYFWDFGDQVTSTQQDPQHTYTASGTYTVTLITTSAAGCTDTISYTVMVELVGITPGANDLFTINGIYPNPFQAAVYFDLNFPISGTVDITVTDVLGRVTHRVAREEVNSGDYRWKWEKGSQLAEGTYIVKVEFAGAVQYEKLVHIR